MIAIVIASFFVLTAVAGLVAHYTAFRSNPLLAVAAFAAYPMLGSLVGLVILLVAREWWFAAVAAVVLLICGWTQLPLYRSQTAPVHSTKINMMTANLRLGSADATKLVELVRDHDVDVLTVQEITPEEMERLKAAGIDAVLPNSAIAARSGGAGSAVYSRFPLTPEPTPAGYYFEMVVTRVQVPGVTTPVTVVATHMPGPWPQNPAAWVNNIGKLPSTLASFAAGSPRGSVLVGGDFNATTDTSQFRRLLADGYRDAAEQSGAGRTRTYPADTWYPPLIAIDHVLTRNAVATKARTLSVPGSDHRALLTTIALPAT